MQERKRIKVTLPASTTIPSAGIGFVNDAFIEVEDSGHGYIRITIYRPAHKDSREITIFASQKDMAKALFVCE